MLNLFDMEQIKISNESIHRDGFITKNTVFNTKNVLNNNILTTDDFMMIDRQKVKCFCDPIIYLAV